MIRINGADIDAEELKLTDYLEENGYGSQRIAVERNEEIVPKAQYGSCILHSGGVVESVSFGGGG